MGAILALLLVLSFLWWRKFWQHTPKGTFAQGGFRIPKHSAWLATIDSDTETQDLELFTYREEPQLVRPVKEGLTYKQLIDTMVEYHHYPRIFVLHHAQLPVEVVNQGVWAIEIEERDTEWAVDLIGFHESQFKTTLEHEEKGGAHL